MKNYHIIVLKQAIQDIQEISAFLLANYSQNTVDRFLDAYSNQKETLKIFPNSFVESKDVPGYRRFNINKYYCGFYQVDDTTKTVYIYRIRNTRMNFKQQQMQATDHSENQEKIGEATANTNHDIEPDR